MRRACVADERRMVSKTQVHQIIDVTDGDVHGNGEEATRTYAWRTQKTFDVDTHSPPEVLCERRKLRK